MIWETVQEWALVRDALLPAIEMTNGTHIEDDVLVGLMTSRYRLWRSGSSGVVTEVVQFPQMKCLHVFLAGGDLVELLPLRETIEACAVSNGCTRITALFVRKGWERMLGDGVKVGGSYAYRDLKS